MLASGGYKKGFVLCDAPAHNTVEELLEMTWEDWNVPINKLDTRTKAAGGKGTKHVDRCSKTGAEYIHQMKTNMELQRPTKGNK